MTSSQDAPGEADGAALASGNQSTPGPNGATTNGANAAPLTAAQRIAHLNQMREKARLGGGERRIQQQHAKAS